MPNPHETPPFLLIRDASSLECAGRITSISMLNACVALSIACCYHLPFLICHLPSAAAAPVTARLPVTLNNPAIHCPIWIQTKTEAFLPQRPALRSIPAVTPSSQPPRSLLAAASVPCPSIPWRCQFVWVGRRRHAHGGWRQKRPTHSQTHCFAVSLRLLLSPDTPVRVARQPCSGWRG